MLATSTSTSPAMFSKTARPRKYAQYLFSLLLSRHVLGDRSGHWQHVGEQWLTEARKSSGRWPLPKAPSPPSGHLLLRQLIGPPLRRKGSPLHLDDPFICGSIESYYDLIIGLGGVIRPHPAQMNSSVPPTLRRRVRPPMRREPRHERQQIEAIIERAPSAVEVLTPRPQRRLTTAAMSPAVWFATYRQ